MIGDVPVCWEKKCKHLWQKPPMGKQFGLACDAFPEGIPDEIIFNGNLHQVPLKDQKNTIVFEA